MDSDDVDRINQILNELEEIPSDSDSILSEDVDTEDHELNTFDDLMADTIFDNFDINNLPIQCY